MYVSDVEGVITPDTLIEEASDWNICWLPWFRCFKPNFATSTPVSTQSCDEKPNGTRFIVAGYTHVQFERLKRHGLDPGEKNLGERGRKMVKIGENGNEIANAHAWTPYTPNIFSLTVTYLTLYIRQGHKGGQKANRDAWVKKWTVIGGRKRHFLRCWQRRHSLWYDFQSLTKRRLQRRSESPTEYDKRPVQKLWNQQDLTVDSREQVLGTDETKMQINRRRRASPFTQRFVHFSLK